MTKIIKMAALSGLIGLTTLMSSSQASLIMELRFPDGGNVKNVNAGSLAPITIQTWAIVTGAAGNANQEGLYFATVALKSSIVTTGLTGSISSVAAGTSWNGPGSSIGVASNLSLDGIGDWGNVFNSTLTTGITPFFRARNVKSVNNPIDWGDINSTGIYHDLPNGGVEFLVGSFTFTPTATTLGGVLKYIPAVPLGGTIGPAGWYEDTLNVTADTPTGSRNVTNGIYSPATPNGSGINGVTINVIPEPASLGLIGLTAICAMRRRRSVSK